APIDGSVPACRRPAPESRLCSVRSALFSCRGPPPAATRRVASLAPRYRRQPASLSLANVTKKAAQAHTRFVHLGLRRPLSDPENLGDLLVLEAFDVVQHEGRPASLRQLTER